MGKVVDKRMRNVISAGGSKLATRIGIIHPDVDFEKLTEK